MDSGGQREPLPVLPLHVAASLGLKEVEVEKDEESGAGLVCGGPPWAANNNNNNVNQCIRPTSVCAKEATHLLFKTVTEHPDSAIHASFLDRMSKSLSRPQV